MALKRCSACKKEHETISFSSNSHRKDGLHNQCNDCRRASAKKCKDKKRREFLSTLKPVERLLGEIFVVVANDGIEYEYLISNFGRVISMKLGFEVLINPSAQLGRCGRPGYLGVSLRDPSRKNYYTSRVHRLVAKAFIPNPDNLLQVNHIDGDKTNNNVTNLEWCTPEHNIRHSFSEKLNIAPRGKDSHLFDKGKKVKLNGVTYNSVAGAARETGIPRTTLSAELISNRKPKYGIEYVD